jgi:hypothetical protein
MMFYEKKIKVLKIALPWWWKVFINYGLKTSKAHYII